MISNAIAFAVIASASAFKTSNDEYTVVSQIRGRSVYIVKSAKTGDRLVVKCGRPHRTSNFKNEFKMMELIGNRDWTLEPVELFMHEESPCIAMEELGGDIYQIRKSSTEKWSVPTVVSIGIGLIDALIELHFDVELVHHDLHPGNVGYRKSDPTHLVVFDYGQTRPAESQLATKRDLKDAVLSMRYYIDGNNQFFMAKQHRYVKADVCRGIPEELCIAIDTVFSFGSGRSIPKETYFEIREMLTSILEQSGIEYDGKIIWDTVAFPPGYKMESPKKISPPKKISLPKKRSPPVPKKEHVFPKSEPVKTVVQQKATTKAHEKNTPKADTTSVIPKTADPVDTTTTKSTLRSLAYPCIFTVAILLAIQAVL
jgi:hypothetical protein